MFDYSDINDMDADDLRAALSGPRDTAVALIRAAAEGGAVEAQLRLGQMLLDGDGIARSAVDALRWFGRAASAGSAMGMNMVGRCAEHGWGTYADKALAAAWYRAAAERGLDWGMYNLATLLALGDGITEDRTRALALFRRAAALGHAKSANMVGSFHEDGWVVARDRRQAAHHYRRAAEGGDFRGRFNHARLLAEDGRIDEACDWLRRVPETATPRFLAQMRAWAASQDDPRLRAFAVDRAD